MAAKARNRTIGYVVTLGKGGPLAHCGSGDGAKIMCWAGASRRYATVFDSRDAAKVAIDEDRKWREAKGYSIDDREMRIVRLESHV